MTIRSVFETLQTRDIRNERRIFWSEIAIIVFLALLVAAYLALSFWLRPGSVPVPRL